MSAPPVQAFLPLAGTLRPGGAAVSHSLAAAGSWLHEMGLAQSQQGCGAEQRQQPRRTVSGHEVPIAREATAFLEGLADVRRSTPAAAEPSGMDVRAGALSSADIDTQALCPNPGEPRDIKPQAPLRDIDSATSSVTAPVRHQSHRLAPRTPDEPEVAQFPIAGAPQPVPAVRVHADWSVEGVRIWLGMDAEGSRSAQVLTAHLQGWLASQGIRALSITCNGKTLYEHWTQPGEPVHPADPHKEQT